MPLTGRGRATKWVVPQWSICTSRPRQLFRSTERGHLQTSGRLLDVRVSVGTRDLGYNERTYLDFSVQTP